MDEDYLDIQQELLEYEREYAEHCKDGFIETEQEDNDL